jgi:diaminopimelate epimerase
MGIARLRRGQIGMTGVETEAFVEQEVGHGYRGTAVSMGNPHLTIFVDDVEKVDLETVGPSLERHPFFPQRTNVHFVQVVDRTHLIQRTWERGAGITLACGTGACASVVAAVITDRSERKVENRLPGGVLEIEVAPEGRVFMTGPAETVFDGSFGH